MIIIKTVRMLAISIVLLILGCQNDNIKQNCDGDNAQSLETFYFQEFTNIPCALQNTEDSEKEIKLIIANEADFEKYFSCYEQLPEIDFEKYLVLAGRYTHHQCAMLGSQQVIICSNKITYKVRVLEKDCFAITSVFYATVIEKKYSDVPIGFDVQLQN